MSLPINLDDLINTRTIESERIDFKKGFSDESIMHTICAFANDINNIGGGYIIIGIEDNGDGVPDLPPKGLEKSQIDAFQKKIISLCHKIEPEYFPVIRPEVFMGKHILVLWVPGGDNRPYKAPVTIKDNANKKYFVRHGSTTKRATAAEDKQLMELASKIPFDDRINRLASIKDFKRYYIEEHLQETGSELYSYVDKMSLEDLCKEMHIVKSYEEKLFPLNVGILFFASDPQKFFRYATIDVVQFFDESGDKFTEKTFTGPIQYQLKEALEFISNQVIRKKIEKVENKAESDVFYNYPFAAVEEALANAVYHRGYDENEPIEVRIETDRIEITSYPGPVPPVTQKTLKKGKIVPRRYRNRRIGDFLKELRLTEGRGTGLRKIRKAMHDNGSPEAVFDTDNQTYFTTILPTNPDFPKGLFKTVPIIMELEAAMKSQVHNKSVPRYMFDNKQLLIFLSQVCPKSVPSGKVVSLISLLTEGEKSKNELMDKLGETNKYRFTKNILTPLMQVDIIEYTIPDKPTSRDQKYRLTNKILNMIKEQNG